jgi:hypothetical protein
MENIAVCAIIPNMAKQSMKSRKTRSFDYPQETEGSRIAASARRETNQLSPAEKEKLRELGMKIAFGHGPKQKVGAGH